MLFIRSAAPGTSVKINTEWTARLYFMFGILMQTQKSVGQTLELIKRKMDEKGSFKVGRVSAPDSEAMWAFGCRCSIWTKESTSFPLESDTTLDKTNCFVLMRSRFIMSRFNAQLQWRLVLKIFGGANKLKVRAIWSKLLDPFFFLSERLVNGYFVKIKPNCLSSGDIALAPH